MPHLSEVLGRDDDQPPPTDADVRTTCPTCGLEQSLDGATLLDYDGEGSRYGCLRCQATLLLVEPATATSWEGRGHVVGDWLVRNPREVVVKGLGWPYARRLERSPGALD